MDHFTIDESLSTIGALTPLGQSLSADAGWHAPSVCPIEPAAPVNQPSCTLPKEITATSIWAIMEPVTTELFLQGKKLSEVHEILRNEYSFNPT